MALELGPCQILFGDEGSEVDLGKTEGGVVVNFGTDVADLTSDQHGTAPEDQVVTGQKATINVPLAEPSLRILAISLNQTRLAAGGKWGIAGGNIVGTKLSSKANSLLIKKYVDGSPSTNSEDWMRFPYAAPVGNFDYPYSKDSQRIINTVFTAFPDPTTDDLYYIGDETAAETGS